MRRRELLGVLGLSTIAGAVERAQAAATLSPMPRAHQATPGFVPDVELSLTAAPDEASILAGARSAVWRFAGRILTGPADTLEVPQIPTSDLSFACARATRTWA